MNFKEFEGILPLKWDPKRVPKLSRNWIRKGRPLESDFYDIIMDFGSQNGTQNLLKKHPKKGLFFASVFIEFWLNFGGQFGRREAPRGTREASRRRPGGTREASRRRPGGVLEPGAALEAPSRPPGLDFLRFLGSKKTHFWHVFVSICGVDTGLFEGGGRPPWKFFGDVFLYIWFYI